MRLVRIRAEYGACYWNAFESLVANASVADEYQIHYVQGTVISTTDGSRIGHAWVELVDPDTGEEYVFEPVPHALCPKAKYYADGDVQNTHRYDLERAVGIYTDRLRDHGDPLGPWTDDVRDAVHSGEDPAPKEDRELVEKAKANGARALEVD